MEQNDSQGLKSKTVNLLKPKIVFIFLFCFAVVSLIVYFSYSTNDKKDLVSNIKPTITNVVPDTKTKLAPEVSFGSYVNKSSFALQESINTYTLKSNFTKDEIMLFAQKLGLNTYNEGNSENEEALISNLADKQKKGIMQFNKQSGSFYYQSFGVVRPANFLPNQSPTQEAYSFLEELGFDNTVTCTNTYQRKGLENTTFVECHRDWSKVKTPIVNLGGILNIPENKKISVFSTGKIMESSLLDDSVINVNIINNNLSLVSNPKDNGRLRPNDFNTITLSISKDGRILSIDSRVRFISGQSFLNKKDLITAQEALNILKNGKAEFSLTIPAGQGQVNFEKVYPGNIAVAKEAVINDISLVFLDKPFDVGQEKYSPSYLIRGTAILDSGYTVKFTQLVPAARADLALTEIANTLEVAGDRTFLAQADEKKLQMDSFDPKTVSPTLTPDLTLSPTLTAVPGDLSVPQEKQCLDDKQASLLGKELTLEIPGYGTLVVVGSLHTYFLKSAKIPNYSYKTVKEAFFRQVEEQFVINVSKWIKYYYKDSAGRSPYRNLPDLNSLNTPEDFYNLFNIINNTPFELQESGALKSDEYMKMLRYGAPMTEAAKEITDNAAYASNTLRNVAERLLVIKNQNQIDVWAAKEDLFPEETIDIAFWGIFVGTNYEPSFKYACYISGNSPVIYFYPTKKTNLIVKTYAPLTYSDPAINNNVWNIAADTKGAIEQAGIQRPNLYYEYDKSKITFTEPEDGFIIKTEKWKEFVKKDLSKKLGLNSKETESLIIEINNTMLGVQKTPYLKLSLIPQSELNQKLPLSINPIPDNIYRINVFVIPLGQKLIIKDPQINQIKRDKFTVVEIGAYSQ